jgi:hypothetical protein
MFTVQMNQDENDFIFILIRVEHQLRYTPVNLYDEFVVHLKKLNDLEILLTEKLDSISINDYRYKFLDHLRKKIKKIEFKYKIFRTLSK